MVVNKPLRILHFNDVYHLLPQPKNEPVGGISRFYTLLNQLRQLPGKPLVLFSGDLFNPSIESSATKGAHMIKPFSKLGVDVACFGNHDFDFGVEELENLSEQLPFPWLISNVFESEASSQPLAKGKLFHVLEHEGTKVGLIGLVEKEWLDTIPHLPDGIVYKDFITAAKELSSMLRKEHGCDVVIALTHMRVPNDKRLSEECNDLDLILGGHDHFSVVGGSRLELLEKATAITCEVIPAEKECVPFVKSGTDFRELCDISLSEQGVKVTHYDVCSTIQANGEMDKLVDSLVGSINESLSKPVGKTLSVLDARSTTARTRESNLGNLVTDTMRHFWPDVDMALIGGGTIRSDTTYGPGIITKRDLLDIFPFEDPVVVIKIKGKHLWEAFESALSMVPKQEGRFPQVSGCRLVYDPQRPPLQRLISVTVIKTTNDYELVEEPLDLTREYQLATRAYMAAGYDGFEALKQSTFVVDDEQGVLINTILHRFFIGLRHVNLLKFQRYYSDGAEDHRKEVLAALAAMRWKKLVVGKRGGTKTALDACKLRFAHVLPVIKSFEEAQAKTDEDILLSMSSIEPEVEGRVVSIEDIKSQQ